MRLKLSLLVTLLLSTLWSCTLTPVFAAPWAVKKPKLVVVIVIDQFRADYISRFQSEFRKDGFLGLIQGGAYFPYGEYDILQSMTAPGHATILTGAYPYQMGIPINEWYDQKRHLTIASVEDENVRTVGLAEGQGKDEGSSSPHNLIGSTLGDELKNAGWPSKVVSLALKDRAAILMGGHRADLAFWYNTKARRWVSSSFYRKDGKLPAWLETLNQKAEKTVCELDQPCSADITLEAFKAALVNEKLGQGKGSDILAVSFSGHDMAGHRFGPNAPEMKAMTLNEDKVIAELRAAVAKAVPGGLQNVVFVLTGDHGVAPNPEQLSGTGLEGGRISTKTLTKKINESLNKTYGSPKRGNWISFTEDFNFYLDEENVRLAKADMTKMQNDIKAILLQEPAFQHVFTMAEYEARKLPPGVLEKRILKTVFPGRSGHVIGIQKPFYIEEGKHMGSHMTSYAYDRMVPIVISGFGIKGGLYSGKTEVVDIAPTLSFLLGVTPPALSEGRVLSEALKSSTAP